MANYTPLPPGLNEKCPLPVIVLLVPYKGARTKIAFLAAGGGGGRLSTPFSLKNFSFFLCRNFLGPKKYIPRSSAKNASLFLRAS